MNFDKQLKKRPWEVKTWTGARHDQFIAEGTLFSAAICGYKRQTVSDGIKSTSRNRFCWQNIGKQQ